MSYNRDLFIGVLAKEEEQSAVHEFFELFKVPYELFKEDHSYNVVLTTQSVSLGVDTKLLLVFSSRELDIDTNFSIQLSKQKNGGVLESDQDDIPIYGELRTISERVTSTPTIPGTALS